MKRCTKCGETKSIEDFWSDNSKKDKKSTICKICRTKYNKIYREQVGELPQVCPQCQKAFILKKGDKKKTYCSRTCAAASLQKSLIGIQCKKCCTPFYVRSSRLRYSDGVFCSHSCAKSYKPLGWAKQYSECLSCKSTKYPYSGGGLCKSCYYKSYSHKIKESARLKHRYGISLEERNIIMTDQKNKCAICFDQLEGKNAHIDHNHFTKKVRGILCSKCNHGLGFFKDNINILKQAIQYLENSDSGACEFEFNIPQQV